jgi:hypothetical protein
MSRRRSFDKSKYTRADVELAAQNLVRKGLIVARTDINGQVVYFIPECAPPLGPFELQSYRRGLKKKRAVLNFSLASPLLRQ